MCVLNCYKPHRSKVRCLVFSHLVLFRAGNPTLPSGVNIREAEYRPCGFWLNSAVNKIISNHREKGERSGYFFELPRFASLWPQHMPGATPFTDLHHPSASGSPAYSLSPSSLRNNVAHRDQSPLPQHPVPLTPTSLQRAPILKIIFKISAVFCQPLSLKKWVISTYMIFWAPIQGEAT